MARPGPKPGTRNNPAGLPRGTRNATMTRRERDALDAENSDDRRETARVVAGRARAARRQG